MAKTERDFERVTIRKRKGGRWYARFRDGGERTEVNLQVTNKVQAVRLAGLIDKDLVDGKPWQWRVGRTRPGERTFSDLMTEYLDRGSRWSESSRRSNASTVRKLVEEFGDTALSKLDRAAVEGYLARRRGEGWSKASRNRYLACVKVVLSKAVEWGYLRQNPAAGVKQEPEGRKLPRPYRDGEVAALLEALDPATRDVARIYLDTGLRRGELMKMLWADVDLVGATLTVRAPKNRRDRVVPLSGRALEILNERRRQWKAEQTDARADLRVYGDRADIAKVVRRAWDDVLAPERCEVLRPVHSFRDTAITCLVGAGVPLPVVQDLAGHSQIEQTRRYAEVSPEAVREAVTRVFG
jgi:integrase